MTSVQKRLVQDSFVDVSKAAEPIGLLFYGRLFELDPSLRPLFGPDMRVQTRKLMSMLETVVSSLDRFDEMKPLLTNLGRRHSSEFHAKPQHYETLRSALLWALGQALEQEFYPEVRAAWSAVIGAVNATMLESTEPQAS